MEGSPQEATTAGDQDRPQPEQRRVRRRLVQSTLFPPKPQENAAERAREDCEKEDGDDDEDYCGSKRKTKRKPKPRASKKVSFLSLQLLRVGWCFNLLIVADSESIARNVFSY